MSDSDETEIMLVSQRRRKQLVFELVMPFAFVLLLLACSCVIAELL